MAHHQSHDAGQSQSQGSDNDHDQHDRSLDIDITHVHLHESDQSGGNGASPDNIDPDVKDYLTKLYKAYLELQGHHHNKPPETHHTDEEVKQVLYQAYEDASQMVHWCDVHPKSQGSTEIRAIAVAVQEQVFELINEESEDPDFGVLPPGQDGGQDGVTNGDHGGLHHGGQDGVSNGAQDELHHGGQDGVQPEDQDGYEPYDEQDQFGGEGEDEGYGNEDEGEEGGEMGEGEDDEYGQGY